MLIPAQNSQKFSFNFAFLLKLIYADFLAASSSMLFVVEHIPVFLSPVIKYAKKCKGVRRIEK